MSLFWHRGNYFVVGALGCLLQSPPSLSQAVPIAAESNQLRNRQHDFGFHPGTWETRISRLRNSRRGSTAWTESNGAVIIRKVRDGRAEFEKIEADGPNGHFKGLTLFLYNSQSHPSSMNFADCNGGTLNQPSIGEFKKSHGEFYLQETVEGRTLLVRIVGSDITPNSDHFEQSFSDDWSKTWEPNFTVALTREKP